jgi:aldose 1-epimerase
MTVLVRLAAGAARLVLAPAIGGAIAEWMIGGDALMRLPQPGALATGEVRGLACYPLVPFSNRIAHGRFRFAGTAYEIAPLLGPHAIHGAGWRLPWQVEAEDTAEATLALDYTPSPLWPFPFRAEQRFGLAEDRLTCEISVINTHTAPAPAGLGLHPFFPRGTGATLQFRAAGVWHNDADMVPTQRTPVPPDWDHAAGRAVGPVALDNCFAGWDGAARIAWPAQRLALVTEATGPFGHLVVYIPDGADYFAVEPASNMNDGLNAMDHIADHGVRILAPGERLAGRVVWRVERT